MGVEGGEGGGLEQECPGRKKIKKLISRGTGESIRHSKGRLYQLGFSVSSSNHLLEQQNLESDSCNVLKENFFWKNFQSVTQRLIIPKVACGWYWFTYRYKDETYTNTNLKKVNNCLADHLYFKDLNAFFTDVSLVIIFPL